MRRASCERRKPAARCSPSVASAMCCGVSVVKKTLACERSGETSTAVRVTMPTRGSRSSRCRRSDSSRWIRSPSFSGRPDRFCFTTPPGRTLKRPRHLDGLEHLELVLLFQLGEALERDAALEAGLDLAHVVL